MSVLEWAFGAADDYPLRRFPPLHLSDHMFLVRIGVVGTGLKDVTWTRELLLRGLDYYAGAVEGTAAEFRADVQDAIDGRVAALTRLVAERAAIIRRTESVLARAGDAALLPPETIAARAMKYERHLHGLLTSTLHELERLQLRRGGTPVIPPVAADLSVTVSVV